MIVASSNKIGDSMLVVECDHCGAHSKRTGRDPGEAAEKARLEGFITIPGASIGSPKSWLCQTCSNVNNT
jgi:hypothetical protein